MKKLLKESSSLTPRTDAIHIDAIGDSDGAMDPYLIVDSVVNGNGLSATGVALLRNAFGEASRIHIVSNLEGAGTPWGIEHRLVAIAFAITQPPGMRPKQQHTK